MPARLLFNIPLFPSSLTHALPQAPERAREKLEARLEDLAAAAYTSFTAQAILNTLSGGPTRNDATQVSLTRPNAWPPVLTQVHDDSRQDLPGATPSKTWKASSLRWPCTRPRSNRDISLTA